MIYSVACTRLINVSGSVKVGCLSEPIATHPIMQIHNCVTWVNTGKQS